MAFDQAKIPPTYGVDNLNPKRESDPTIAAVIIEISANQKRNTVKLDSLNMKLKTSPVSFAERASMPSAMAGVSLMF